MPGCGGRLNQSCLMACALNSKCQSFATSSLPIWKVAAEDRRPMLILTHCPSSSGVTMALELNQLFRMCNVIILCLPPQGIYVHKCCVNSGIRQGEQLLNPTKCSWQQSSVGTCHMLNVPPGPTGPKSSWLPSHGSHHQWPQQSHRH